MTFLCTECNEYISNASVTAHPGHKLLKQSHLGWEYTCTVLTCGWKGEQARMHWQESGHANYTTQRVVTDLDEYLSRTGQTHPLGKVSDVVEQSRIASNAVS